MIKHAFLLLVHKEPELMDRILNHIVAPNHYIYIHVDAKNNYDDFVKVASKYKNIEFTKRYNVIWGGFTMIQSETAAYKIMYDSEEKYDYFHLISGQDYPCVDRITFDRFFKEHYGESFMKIDSPEVAAENRRTKYSYRLENYFFYDNLKSPFANKYKVARIFSKGIRWIPRPYKNMESVWGGWQWHSLHRNVLKYYLDFFETHPKFVKRFRMTACCDEMIFSTILRPVSQELNIQINNALRFVEWNPKRKTNSLPLLLEETEYEDIVDSGAFLCRKVDLVKSKVLLDMLDNRIESM